MSKYDLEYLREYFRVGFVDDLGEAWWSTWGDIKESHYPGAIPTEDVNHFLGWQPVKVQLMREGQIGEAIPLTDYAGSAPVGIVHPETAHLLGIVSADYIDTGYRERLIDGLTKIIDDSLELKVGSMGMIDGGRQAFLQIRTADVWSVGSESYYPWITAYSSLDYSLKTAFKAGATRDVCDNTFDLTRAEDGLKFSYKNTKNSGLNVPKAREMLALLSRKGEEYRDELERMVEESLSAEGWEKLLELVIPTPQPETKTGITRAQNVRDAISEVYFHDDRVGTHVGSKFGAFQAFSTYYQHPDGKDAAEGVVKNINKLFSGSLASQDAKVRAALQLV